MATEEDEECCVLCGTLLRHGTDRRFKHLKALAGTLRKGCIPTPFVYEHVMTLETTLLGLEQQQQQQQQHGKRSDAAASSCKSRKMVAHLSSVPCCIACVNWIRRLEISCGEKKGRKDRYGEAAAAAVETTSFFVGVASVVDEGIGNGGAILHSGRGDDCGQKKQHRLKSSEDDDFWGSGEAISAEEDEEDDDEEDEEEEEEEDDDDGEDNDDDDNALLRSLESCIESGRSDEEDEGNDNDDNALLRSLESCIESGRSDEEEDEDSSSSSDGDGYGDEEDNNDNNNKSCAGCSRSLLPVPAICFQDEGENSHGGGKGDGIKPARGQVGIRRAVLIPLDYVLVFLGNPGCYPLLQQLIHPPPSLSSSSPAAASGVPAASSITPDRRSMHRLLHGLSRLENKNPYRMFLTPVTERMVRVFAASFAGGEEYKKKSKRAGGAWWTKAATSMSEEVQDTMVLCWWETVGMPSVLQHRAGAKLVRKALRLGVS